MASILRMPGISADAEEAVLLEWLVAEGSEVKSGNSLAIVETEKANVDIESDQDAILWRVLATPGTSVSVGAPIAILVGIGEAVGDEASVFGGLGLPVPGAAPVAAPVAEVPVAAPVASPAPVVEPAATSVPDTVAAPAAPVVLPAVAGHTTGRIFASPLARRIARENGIDVATIQGTGSGGRITRVDVERALTSAPLATADSAPTSQMRVESNGTGYIDIPHNGMRKAVARFLSQSKREAPHFYLNATCRVDSLLELRKQLNADGSTRVSINDFVVKAVAKTLADVPEMNVIWMDEAVRQYDSVDISVAIGSDKGLVTPVIRSAERLTLTQISAQVKDFAERANEGRLKQSELEGGSFTITNLGMFGVESFSAIINPPQVGILAVGAVRQEPIVIEGEVTIGNVLSVTVSVDHRPVDGVLAAKWLHRFTELIENPVLILS